MHIAHPRKTAVRAKSALKQENTSTKLQNIKYINKSKHRKQIAKEARNMAENITVQQEILQNKKKLQKINRSGTRNSGESPKQKPIIQKKKNLLRYLKHHVPNCDEI